MSLVVFLSCLLWQSVLWAETSPAPDPSRSLRLCEVRNVESVPPPNMNASRYGVEKLIDGKLPRDGQSSWTKWYQQNPVLTFDCGSERRMGAIRIFFQAWSRDDELKTVDVEVSLNGKDYSLFNRYGNIVTPRERGAWVEMDLRSVRARYFRLTPRFQGWGHQWGEVEFWELSN
jgi:hypothetical protein